MSIRANITNGIEFNIYNCFVIEWAPNKEIMAGRYFLVARMSTEADVYRLTSSLGN